MQKNTLHTTPLPAFDVATLQRLEFYKIWELLGMEASDS